MRLVFVLRCLLAWLIVTTAQGAPGSGNAPVVQLVLELSDGSRVIGTPAFGGLKMATEYANFEIPLSLLSTLELTGTGGLAEAHLKNGDVLHTQLDAREIAMTTVFGQVSIPLAQVHHIQIRGIGGAMPDGMVLYYTFDANDGDRVADVSHTGNDGKVRGATYTSQGKMGGAMSFRGGDQAIVVGNPASLRLQDFSIMAWIKRGSLAAAGAPEGDATNSAFFGYGRNGYDFGMFPDGQLFLTKTEVDAVRSDCAINDEGFHHVAVTKQGTQVTFYLDGVAFPAAAYNPGFEFDTDAAVGARADIQRWGFAGVIDEVAVFNRPLSADEVKRVYDSQK
jgi:hypothetical protein